MYKFCYTAQRERVCPQTLPLTSELIFFGFNKAGTSRGRLVVIDQRRSHLAREYSRTKTPNLYNCLGCGKQHWLTAIIKEDTILIPDDSLHSSECKLRVLADIKAKQDQYNTMFSPFQLALANASSEELEKMVPIDDEDSDFHDVAYETPRPAKARRVSEAYFSSPSSFWLRRAVERLNLPYFPGALLTWAKIDIDRISVDNAVDEAMSLEDKTHSGFRCLAMLLLGNEHLYPLIQASLISQCFQKQSIKTSNATECANKLSALCSDDLTNDNFHNLSVLLDCRIGLFSDGGLHTFGIWSDEPSSQQQPTILLTDINGSFQPVLTLK